jgi:hypothetical protein
MKGKGKSQTHKAKGAKEHDPGGVTEKKLGKGKKGRK